MFTGIITEVGRIDRVLNKDNKKYFVITCDSIQKELKIGDSIACDGICLTITSFDKTSITAEAMRETLIKTTAGDWQINREINLEPALTLQKKLGGHLVQGHVDNTAAVISRKKKSGTYYLRIAAKAEYNDLIVEQGSITINGVSLTIASIDSQCFEVALIEHTRENTNLKNKYKQVNVEYDIIGKYVRKMLGKSKDFKYSQKWLLEKGF